MFVKVPERIFFILASLLIIVVVYFNHPYFKSQFSTSYQEKLLTEFTTQLSSGNFDAEYYWEFRERYSPGYFLRDEDNTNFTSTFKIVDNKLEFIPLFYYNSDRLQSVDSLIAYDTVTAIESIKEEFSGETLYTGDNFVYIKVNDNEYVFAFVESIDTMKKVNGMFDYLPEEQELLKNKLWYNATYLKVK
jgi:hypothetical protein